MGHANHTIYERKLQEVSFAFGLINQPKHMGPPFGCQGDCAAVPDGVLNDRKTRSEGTYVPEGTAELSRWLS